MSVFKRGMFGGVNRILIEIFLLLLFIFAAVKCFALNGLFRPSAG